MLRRLIPFGLLAIAGCASSPSRSPDPAAAERIAGAFITRSTAIDLEPVPDDWWQLYRSAELDTLVQASLAANADLRVAYANLDGARASLFLSRANRLPQTSIESGLKIDNTSAQPSAAGVPSTDWDLALTASWDLDLFGRLRSGALAASADRDAQQAASEGIRVAVVADTVQAYLELCGATRALTQASEVVTASERLVTLVQRQLEAGEVSPLELSQARTLAITNRASLMPWEVQRANALYRLAALQGRAPAEGPNPAPVCDSPPTIGEPIPVGDASALLLRRPDIREAERRLAAATHRIGVARADLYPRLNLGGAVGVLAGSFDTVATPLMTWAFPNISSARARIAQAQAGERATLANWDSVVLRALKDVETAIAAYDGEVRRNQQLTIAEYEAESYVRRAEARVRLGDAASLTRLDAERTLAGARLQRVQSDLAIGQAQVALFRALGGGWSGTPIKR